MLKSPTRIFILTGAFDDAYLATRTDDPVVCTSAGKRLVLYRAIEEATGSKVTLLSPHPRGRKPPYPIDEFETTFGTCRQFFSRASARRKIRFVLDIIHYARHVFQHTRDGAVLMVDNYEISYILACWYCRLRGRRNPIILEYEDGKHEIDKGLWRFFSGLAEWLGKPLVKAAIAATPTLLERLPANLPSEVVPGMLEPDRPAPRNPPPGDPVRFIYSGSLDFERGVPLLLDYLESTFIHPEAEFHITGQGHFVDRIQGICRKMPGKVMFHGILSREDLEQVRRSCHFGLNLQSSSNPISRVTFPSKTFDYLNDGLRVVTTHAAGVDAVLGEEAIYLESETIEGLAGAVSTSIHQARLPHDESASSGAGMDSFTYQGTVKRLNALFQQLPS